MNRAVIIITAVILVVLLGVGIARVGNVGIRRVQPPTTKVELTLPQPVLPGVATVVKWTVPPTLANRQILFEVRHQNGTVIGAESELTRLSAAITFPCLETTAPVSLVMLDGQTEQVLASTSVALLPAGPDCAR